MSRYNRVEFVDHTRPHFNGGGRIAVITGDVEVELLEQDNGKTLKVVVASDKESLKKRGTRIIKRGKKIRKAVQELQTSRKHS